MMGPIDFDKLVMGLLMLIAFAVGVLMLISWVSAWVSKKVMLHFNLEPLSITQMWKRYLLILGLSQIALFVLSYLMMFILGFLSSLPMNGSGTLSSLTVILFSVVALISSIVVFAWFISLWLKDAHGQPLGFKIAVIISFIVTLLIGGIEFLIMSVLPMF